MTYPKLVAVAIAAAALTLAGCASDRGANDGSASRSAGEFTSDAALTTKVKTAIAHL